MSSDHECEYCGEKKGDVRQVAGDWMCEDCLERDMRNAEPIMLHSTAEFVEHFG